MLELAQASPESTDLQQLLRRITLICRIHLQEMTPLLDAVEWAATLEKREIEEIRELVNSYLVLDEYDAAFALATTHADLRMYESCALTVERLERDEIFIMEDQPHLEAIMRGCPLQKISLLLHDETDVSRHLFVAGYLRLKGRCNDARKVLNSLNTESVSASLHLFTALKEYIALGMLDKAEGAFHHLRSKDPAQREWFDTHELREQAILFAKQTPVDYSGLVSQLKAKQRDLDEVESSCQKTGGRSYLILACVIAICGFGLFASRRYLTDGR